MATGGEVSGRRRGDCGGGRRRGLLAQSHGGVELLWLSPSYHLHIYFW
ncbi:hypothetical protein CASFOL_016268 [Castilleja foliolosa]|uniref:Uncharacterized protein n=1 Tax=Castilleja foliolosa TaxID=1961234 RepID=A0ABD3DG37_9LAMI